MMADKFLNNIMKDYIRIFGKKIPRNSFIYRTIRLLGKTGRLTGFILEPRKIDINKVFVPLKRLPQGLTGFKIVHLSDIHAGDYVRERYLNKVINMANALEPDIAVITGDFTETGPEDIRWSAKILSTINTKYGIYSVMGNHDYWNGEDEITETLRQNNIFVLRNENITLTINDENLCIAGIDDYNFGKFDIEKAIEGLPEKRILVFLSHHPDIIELIDKHDVKLLLSGHIHGGQWNLPLIGPPLIPSKFGKNHAWGLSNWKDTYIYTSKGIGTTSIPFRINCPPEITLLTLVNIE